MHLFKRSVSPQEKWHKKALFVNPGKTRIILVSTADPEQEGLPLWVAKEEPDSAIKGFFEEEQYGFLGPFYCSCIRSTEVSCGIGEGKGLTLFSFPRAFAL